MASSSSSSLRHSAPEFFPKTYTQNSNLSLLLSSPSSSLGEDGGNLPNSGVTQETKVIAANKEEKGFSTNHFCLSASTPAFIPSKCRTTTLTPTPTLTPPLDRLSMEWENLPSEFVAAATDAESQRPKSRSKTDQKSCGEPPLGLCDTYPKNSRNQVTANIGLYNCQEKTDPIHFIRHEKHTEEAMKGGSSHQSEPYLDVAPTGVGVPFASSLHSHNGKKEHSTYMGDKCLGMSEDVSSFTEMGLGLEGEDDAEECFRSGRMKSSEVLLDSINFINQSGCQFVRSTHYLSQVLVHILSSKSSEAFNNDDAMALQSRICALSYCLLKQTRRGFATDSDIKEN